LRLDISVMRDRGRPSCGFWCVCPCDPFGLTLFGTFWRDHGTMLPLSASGACFRQAPGGRCERPVPLMSNSDGSQNGLRYRCGLCSARANRACRTPDFSGCGCAAVGPEPGTDAACTYLAPLMTACAFGSFRKPCPHYTAHRCGRQTRIHARRPAMGSGAQPQLQIQIRPDGKGHRLSAESRGAPGEAVAEPSLKAVGV